MVKRMYMSKGYTSFLGRGNQQPLFAFSATVDTGQAKHHWREGSR
jgi:hypothetical protein